MAMDSDCSAISLYREVRAMSDYIRREDAVEQVKELFEMGDCYCDCHSIVGMLNMLPSADVVEVVRCKDCTYANFTGLKGDRCYCLRWGTYSFADEYCSYGEKRL